MEERTPDVPRFAVAIRVVDSDIDRQGHVNNVAFLRFIQDAAAAHWTALAPQAALQAIAWVVRRHEIEYLRPGFPGDQLLAHTWVGEPSGATWERFTEIATMKCLGALDGFVMTMFVFEALIQGALGGVVGVVLGVLLAVVRMLFEYGPIAGAASGAVGELSSAALLSLVIGVLLAAVAAVGPSFVAARLAPMEAMRVD